MRDLACGEGWGWRAFGGVRVRHVVGGLLVALFVLALAADRRRMADEAAGVAQTQSPKRAVPHYQVRRTPLGISVTSDVEVFAVSVVLNEPLIGSGWEGKVATLKANAARLIPYGEFTKPDGARFKIEDVAPKTVTVRALAAETQVYEFQ